MNMFYILSRLFGASPYKKKSFFKAHQKPFCPQDAGARGEYLIFKALRSFERQGGRFLFNLYIPKPNDDTTEIDMVLMHPKGLFVIESKNFSGWIFGSENSKYWTQSLPKGRGQKSHKVQFYNPIHQNGAHIKHLKRMLSEKTPMWSLIVFSDHCTFKSLNISPDHRYKVVKLHQIKSMVNQLIKETDADIFSAEDIEWMYEELYPFTQEDEAVKARHVEANHWVGT